MTQNDKVAFITGANRGLGLETARALGEQGITVVIGSRDAGKGQEAADALREKGFNAEMLEFDVTQPLSYQTAYDYFDKKYGKLDILVNNAAIAREDMSGNSTSTVEMETLREIFDTNFFAVVELTQVLLPLIRKAPAGRIVNLSSILGSLTLHSDPKSPIYSAKPFGYDSSKTALNAFTVHLAHELKDTKIKVNSAHPGWVKTEMGGPQAPMELSEGGKTSAQLATVGEDGPNGGYFHLGQKLPW